VRLSLPTGAVANKESKTTVTDKTKSKNTQLMLDKEFQKKQNKSTKN